MAPDLPGVVSIHKFSAGHVDKDHLAQQIGAFVEDNASNLPGLTRVTVLSEYGGNHVAIIAEWETHEAWADSESGLYGHPRLRELLAGTTGVGGTNEAYTPVTVAPRA
jgi:heme-degrading monooxygenase HmoA